MSAGFRSDMDAAAEFVRVWQSANSAQEVAEHFKSTLSSVSSAAAGMRRKGVPLKMMGGRRGVDYGELARLAKSVVHAES